MNKYLPLTALFSFTVFTQTAFAHTGVHEVSGLLSGVSHPFLGLDHLLVMLGVGLWASRLSRLQAGLTIAAFLTFLLLGAVLALLGFGMENVETGIVGSVFMVGLLLSVSRQLPAVLTICLLASFAVLHGFAHGLEIPLAASPVQYAIGFLLATALLHGLGFGLGTLLHKYRLGLRICGYMTSALGIWLLINA